VNVLALVKATAATARAESSATAFPFRPVTINGCGRELLSDRPDAVAHLGAVAATFGSSRAAAVRLDLYGRSCRFLTNRHLRALFPFASLASSSSSFDSRSQLRFAAFRVCSAPYPSSITKMERQSSGERVSGDAHVLPRRAIIAQLYFLSRIVTHCIHLACASQLLII